jgi:hypothetical protein
MNTRFIVMHKADRKHEDGTPPPKQLIEEMGALIGEIARAGILLAGEGLHPSKRRMRLSFRSGDCTIQKGPYDGEHELPAAFAAIRVRTEAEAIAWARSFAAAIGGDVDLELGALTEYWDLGMGERPADAPLRFLIVQKANAATEAGRAPSAQSRAALAKLLDEATRGGVLQFHEVMHPSATARRLLYRDNVRRVVDGPFVESKELIGGFCMMQMRSVDEVVEFCDRYTRILGGTLEIDLRTVADPVGGAR